MRLPLPLGHALPADWADNGPANAHILLITRPSHEVAVSGADAPMHAIFATLAALCEPQQVSIAAMFNCMLDAAPSLDPLPALLALSRADAIAVAQGEHR